MRPNAQALERPLPKRAATARARAAHAPRRRLHVEPFHVLLAILAAAITAVVALPGLGTGAHASCGAAAVMTEFACVDGQVPQNHPGRTCVIDSSVYGTNLWRCAFEN